MTLEIHKVITVPLNQKYFCGDCSRGIIHPERAWIGSQADGEYSVTLCHSCLDKMADNLKGWTAAK